MAHRNKVVRSINAPGAQVCVDIFQMPDGQFGFAEYRRDPEDLSGWRPTGLSSRRTFKTLQAAEAAAGLDIAWLADQNAPE